MLLWQDMETSQYLLYFQLAPGTVSISVHIDLFPKSTSYDRNGPK
jgi:hypothetical protein